MAGGGVDVRVVFDRFIGGGDEIDRLQTVLSQLAPEWWAGAHVYIGPGRREPIDRDAGDGLRRAALSAAFERGPVYDALVREHGAGDERRFGSAEIRGASPALTVVLSVDERPLSWMHNGELALGNRVALQVRRQRVAGTPVREWAPEALRALASQLDPSWGAACSRAEYDAKVMSDYPDEVRAIGWDLGRFLPGLFWLNLFGDRYIDLIGRERLIGAPAAEVADTGRAIVLRLGSDPEAWASEEHRSVEESVREHLGADLFFDKSAPDRPTRAPDWEPTALRSSDD